MKKECSNIMPLLGSAFNPGEARKSTEKWEDNDFRAIGKAEYEFFSGRAEACANATGQYLSHENIDIRMSACLLHCFSNLTLGNVYNAGNSVGIIKQCLQDAWKEDWDESKKASCVFAAHLSTVLLHIPTDDLPKLNDFMKYFPIGIRLYTIYIMAHETYLFGDYARALGMAQSAFLLADATYPIPMIYLYCLMSMCYINLKEQEKARENFMAAWKLARKDEFLEPFIEHHGLFQGMVESCLRKNEPTLYKQISNGVIAFSRGWMKIHNPTMKDKITAKLTPMEYSIAMLACRGWTNQEIAEYLDLSINTIKHYVSGILEKLEINKREQIKDFVNQ